MALLSFKRTFDTSIEIGDVKVPIHVQRVSKAELEMLDTEYERLVVFPRGVAPIPEGGDLAAKTAFFHAETERLKDWNKTTDRERFQFFDDTISKYITLESGLIEDCGTPVTDGAGLVRIFHGRRDVLRDLVQAVRDLNHLSDLMRKNSNSLPASDTGSEQLIRSSDGAEPVSAAPRVGENSSASGEPATELLDSKVDSPLSSGALIDEGKVH